MQDGMDEMDGAYAQARSQLGRVERLDVWM
jgi:hypothetical protein